MDGGFDSSWVWGIGLIAFAFGVAAGAGFSLLLRGGSKRVRELEEEITKLEGRFGEYRQQVNQHFHTTSELVQKMTDSYRDVYEHLASGSEALCRTELGKPGLEFTRKPLPDADRGAPTAPPEQEFADAETDPLQDAESETCMGDSPRVPRLDIEDQPATSRTP